MSSATIELYNALVSAGVEKEKASQVANDVVTRDDAQNFATKSDIANLKADLAALETRFYRGLALQTVTIIGSVVGLLQIF